MAAAANLRNALARALPTRRSRIVVAALSALALAALARAVAARTVPAYVAERRPLTQRVVASGRVMPPARISLGSLSLAKVVEVPVREGDAVQAGRLLVRLDDAAPRAQLSQARARVQEAAARLDQVRGVVTRTAAETVRQAELRTVQAERDLDRVRRLFDAGSASGAQLEDAERAVALARSQADAAAAQAATVADAGADQRLAAAVLREAEAAAAVARARLDETQIRAPAAGRVILREVEPGDVVQAGRTLLVLAQDGETLLSVQLDEKNLAFVKEGNAASVVADAFPDRPFDAAVTFVAPAVDPARGTVEVRLTVAAPPPFLRPDMTVSVNVQVGRNADALVVPSDAVRDPATDPWVLRVEGGRAERRAVRLGLRGEGMLEILEGLAPGDAVVPHGAGSVEAGTRVRVRRVDAPGERDRAL